MQIGRFFDFILQYIFVQVVKAQVGQKEKFNDRVSQDYRYLCVNIIRSYICLGSNHQLRSRGPMVFAIKAVRRDMTVFQAIYRPQSWSVQF